VLAGHHPPLRVCILCLYFMGLNLSNAQIAQELGLNPDDVQRITEPLRHGIVARQPEPTLSGEVECDEVYGVAGHQGHPEAVKKRSPGSAAPAEGGARPGYLGKRKAADFRDDPVGRGGAVMVRMLDNVQQATIRPLIERFIAPGTRVHTDEYDIYQRLTEWGFDHRTVCHSRGEIRPRRRRGRLL